MFGKKDPVITGEDVGNFVKKLHDEGQPLKEILHEVDEDGLAFSSKRTTTRAQDKNSMHGMRYGRQQPISKPRK